MFSLKRSFKRLMAPLAVAVLLFSSLHSGSLSAGDLSDSANFKIENSYANGEIDIYTSLLYKLMIRAGKTDMLPEKYAGEVIQEECGSMFVDELSLYWNSFTQEQKQEMLGIYKYCQVLEAKNEDQLKEITRALHPTLTETLNSKKKDWHFVIHYTTTPDADHNEITDLKLPKTIAAAMELSYKWFKDKYGKTAKNATPMDVYIVNSSLMGGSWGECWQINVDGQTCESYIRIKSTISSDTNANYKKFGAQKAKSTPAHEYFHAVQNNIDRTETTFMKESSAAWCEGVIFSDNKTYVVIGNRVPLFNLRPNWPLWYENDGYHYATMVFQRYMYESLKDVYVNSDMWKECEKVAGDNSLAAVGTVLTARGLDWDKTMKEFGAWNYLKKYKDCSKYKTLWPSIVPSGDHNTYGVEEISPATPLYELGTDYVEFKKPANLAKDNGGELFIKYKPVTGDPVKASLILLKGKKFQTIDFPEDSTDANGFFEYMTEGFQKLDKVILMTQVRTTAKDATARHYSYAAACPLVTMKSWDPDPASIGPASSSTLTLKFDVEGCWNAMDYPLKYKCHIKGPGKVSDGVSDLVVQVQNGTDIENTLYFNTGWGDGYVPGVYKIGIQFVFGTSKKTIAKTKILWLEVVCEKPADGAVSMKGAGKPASISLAP